MADLTIVVDVRDNQTMSSYKMPTSGKVEFVNASTTDTLVIAPKTPHTLPFCESDKTTPHSDTTQGCRQWFGDTVHICKNWYGDRVSLHSADRHGDCGRPDRHHRKTEAELFHSGGGIPCRSLCRSRDHLLHHEVAGQQDASTARLDSRCHQRITLRLTTGGRIMPDRPDRSHRVRIRRHIPIVRNRFEVHHGKTKMSSGSRNADAQVQEQVARQDPPRQVGCQASTVRRSGLFEPQSGVHGRPEVDLSVTIDEAYVHGDCFTYTAQIEDSTAGRPHRDHRAALTARLSAAAS